VRKRCKFALEFPARDFEHVLVGALAMGSCYTYRVGRIAGEVAVFYIQGPAVPDRSAALCSNRKVRKEKKSCEIPGRDIASLRDNSGAARLTYPPILAWLRVKLANVTCRVPEFMIAPP
jgi:hypothetical protein